jgi:hypothetical protein
MKSDGIEYPGIEEYYSPKQHHNHDKEACLAVVLFDGEPDFWFLTGDQEIALDSLKRYYASEWAGTDRTFEARLFKPVDSPVPCPM